MESDDFKKNGDEVPVIEAETVDDETTGKGPFTCPECGKVYKTPGPFEWHVKHCTGKPARKARVPLTDEERLANRAESAKKWNAKRVTITLHLIKDSDDATFLEAQIEALEEADEKANAPTYFKQLLAKAKKNAIKRGDWEKVVEA